MLILHTADLHLTSKDPSRLQTLDWIINKTNEIKVDCLVIAGDLFDSDTEGTILRTEVRKIFERSRSKIFLLPGNHDLESYGLNYDYGKNTQQLINKPFELFYFNHIKFLAIPFQPKKFSECIMELSENPDVIIAHGTLYDLSILPVLNQEDTEYMPIYPGEIENLCRCILLGHIHSTYIDLNYKKTKVLYSGAPIALNTKCRSPRKVVLVDIDEKRLDITPIDIDFAPYWQELNYFVFPGNEEKILNRIEIEIKDLSEKNILPEINIRGYITGSENEFIDKMNKIIEKFEGSFKTISLNCNDIHSWDRLLKNAFVQKFVERTSNLNDELRMKILELTLPYMDEVLK
uniref:Calcineurin-like phosphoesterase domain-containing protein n=1 Tax=candidate division WOR-3 bacterium TaxID=2052148 RepID=A0A7C6AFP6_UNCW3